MKKQMLMKIASVLLLASMLVSCAPKPPSDPSKSAEKDTVSTESTISNEDNFNDYGTLPVVKEKRTLSLGVMQDANVISYAADENFLTKYMEDTTNVELTLEMFPATDAEQKLELMVASNAKLPDMLSFGMANDIKRYSYGESGAIIPLNDLYASDLAAGFNAATANHETFTPEEFKKYVTSPDGNIYGMIDFTTSVQNHYQVRSWLNHDWLNTLGLEAPTTQEELLTVLRAFRDQDPNGNGQADEIPMIGSVDGWNANVILYLMQQYTYIPQQAFNRNNEVFYTAKDGIIDVPYDKDEWRDGLRFIQSLVEEGLLSPQSFTQDGTQYNALASSEVPVVGLGVGGSVGPFADNIQYYEALDAIEGPTGEKNVAYAHIFPTIRLAITRDCEDPELAFLWAQTGYIDPMIPSIQRNGIPEVDWQDISQEPDVKGVYDAMGYPATMRTLNHIWGVPQSSHWQGAPLPHIGDYASAAGNEWSGNENDNEYKNAKAVMKLDPFKPVPEDTWTKAIYTSEEVETTSDIRSALNEYITESMARFVMGDMDLDTDWDSYLAELENLQYKELMEIDQEAYTRTLEG